MAFTAVLLAVAFLAPAILAADDPTISLPGVNDLTPDTFDKLVNGGKHALVEFYAPWCGHCKHLVPEYKKLGEAVQNDPKLKNRVVVAKVDADAHRSLGERFDVHGFPTIKFFPRGKTPSKDAAASYEGGRTAEAFLEFLKKKLEEDKGFARVEQLDSIAKKFADGEGKAADLIAEAKEALAEVEEDAKDNANLYIKYMEKAVEKGNEYLKTEKARLDRMLSSGNVHATKVDEMTRKSSILGAFVDEE